MRYKKPSWENYAIQIKYKNGEIYKKSRWKDPYLLTYATNLYNRPSCSNCNAKKFPRSSDLTLGDFWQIDTLKQIPREIDVKKGVSVIIGNSQKGNELLKKIKEKIFIFEIPNDVFPNMFERYSSCSEINPNRKNFFKEIETNSFSNTAKSYTKKQLYSRCRFLWLKFKRILKK